MGPWIEDEEPRFTERELESMEKWAGHLPRGYCESDYEGDN